MKKDTFKLTTTELANEVGISRSYLYKKAKKIGLELNGRYTKEDLKSLKTGTGSRKKSVSKSVSSNEKRHTKETLKGDTFSITEKDLRNQISDLQKQIATQNEQLKIKDEQIKMANQLADQSQKLQASLQSKIVKKQKLLTTHKKNFWSRMFGKQK
ncbi:hypothetical protein [Fructobacillus tropaeoli]|uniref:DUF536 domain-containing protein n=1 Tax=Fructobacillus tropaeoli TaxID=709323 RepID=A0A3F3HCJ8_9LACO|nr:hypothetical protein [Fructobacillus tropaeoli]GAP05078.1 hypothetical protein FTRO_0400020 [Fructobacillus tropaeoli]